MFKRISFGIFVLLTLTILIFVKPSSSQQEPIIGQDYDWVEDTKHECFGCYITEVTDMIAHRNIKIENLNEESTYVVRFKREVVINFDQFFSGVNSYYFTVEAEEDDYVLELGEVISNITIALLDVTIVTATATFGAIESVIEGSFPALVMIAVVFGVLLFMLRGNRMGELLGFSSPRRSYSKKTEDEESRKGKEDDGRCSKCGTTKEDDDKYCLNCGHDLKKKYKPSKNNKNNDKTESRNEEDSNPLPFTNPDNKIFDHFQDSDNDGTIDSLDMDDDDDGLPDVLDWDDDNDGIPDTFDFD